MKISKDRILTTHVGSLPRPADLVEMLKQRQAGEPVDAGALDARIKSATVDIVRQQADAGIDVVSDGEMSKIGFIPYINERLDGFAWRGYGANQSYWGESREAKAFPDYYEWAAKQSGTAGGTGSMRWTATGPIKYRGHAALQKDIENFRAALNGVKVEEAFIPSISVGNIVDWNKNEYYKNDEDYIAAVADAMHEEYKAIVDAGFLVQIDDPNLATYYVLHPEKDLKQVRNWAHVCVEALNHALRGIPREKVRYHTCYSINMGPRLHDMEGKDILDIVLKVNAGAYSFEAANPRHEHEWKLWGDKLKLPAGSVIIPGVISHSTNLIEHEELVAERLVRFASMVGRENVIAGADCGFASFATSLEVHNSIVWAKFKNLVEGARIASKQLWA
jgi:5-methyltetrahydropteroyltriglutamate--homocysteine methyltransferase